MKSCPLLRVVTPAPRSWKKANRMMIQKFLKSQDLLADPHAIENPDLKILRNVSERVNRGLFCPSEKLSEKFRLDPCPLVRNDNGIGYKATLSAFPVHWEAVAKAVHHWHRVGIPSHPIRILDIGSGSGYLLALFGKLLEKMKLRDGELVGVELLPELVEFSQRQLCQFYPNLNIVVHQGDGWLGDPTWKKGDPLFDVINVGAASKGLPQLLFQQLAPGGIMIIPLECRNGEQFMYTFGKAQDGTPIPTPGIPVRYVPLVPTGGTLKSFEC